jgi:putative radical SAM enzyme (TIGR03279 family)
MINITEIIPDTIASELNLKVGDKVISINGHSINDQLDYRFYSTEDELELLIKRDGHEVVFEIEKETDEDLGLILEEMKMKSCGNSCVFCFVYQNPKGLRKPLYFKDEDYRFSFLYGHYVTLTTVTQEDLDRIVEQQLSPLYISVHSTEAETRRLLLGLKKEDFLLEKIKFLVDHGIELHTQIVLCPGINDGHVFDQTVDDLQKFYPGIKSIAVVPVGLTKHRKNLYDLRLHTRPELEQMISYTENIRIQKKKELGISFVYLSDEFFIKAGRDMPDEEYYDDFYQIENGVGEFRDMINSFNKVFSEFPASLKRPIKITWVTGELAAGNLEKNIISKLRTIENLAIDLVPVTNHFYGEAITVSGLLTGQDIYNRLRDLDLGDLVLLPPRVLNHNRQLLDDWNIEELQSRLNTPCHVYTESLAEFIEVVEGY